MLAVLVDEMWYHAGDTSTDVCNRERRGERGEGREERGEGRGERGEGRGERGEGRGERGEGRGLKGTIDYSVTLF